MTIFSRVTNTIKVTVVPVYLDQQSFPYEEHYAWAYNVRLENQGTKNVQLLNRYWQIIDANGHVKEVRGPGVVGEQPTLKPGEAFEYTSGTLLPTHSGLMAGAYEMITDDGELMDIAIPAFSLDSTQQLGKPN